MIGIEFVSDQKTKKPFENDERLQGLIMEACLEEGLVVYPGGAASLDIRAIIFFLHRL